MLWYFKEDYEKYAYTWNILSFEVNFLLFFTTQYQVELFSSDKIKKLSDPSSQS